MPERAAMSPHSLFNFTECFSCEVDFINLDCLDKSILLAHVLMWCLLAGLLCISGCMVPTSRTTTSGIIITSEYTIDKYKSDQNDKVQLFFTVKRRVLLTA